MSRRVVITGLGVVTSLSQDVNDLFQRLLAGESGIHELKIVDRDRFKVKIGGDVYDWDPSADISNKEAKRLDRFSQFGLVAGIRAVEDSGLQFDSEDVRKCGVILGSGIGGLTEIENQVERLLYKGPDRVSALTIPKLMLNAAGGNISIRYGLRGINYSVATACASANNAMGNAFQCVQAGVCDVVVTGGTEAAMTQMGVSGFQNMKALSMRNDEPARASRPFDIDRDGFVLSEGAGVLIFEELEHAKARGAKIYCEVMGFGASGDAGHITQPDPAGLGASQAMSGALNDANINPDQVDYVNAHGTSTPLGDKAETQAIKSVYGSAAAGLNVSSTKSSLGHSLGASGGIELVVTCKAIESSTIPPTINLDDQDPECDLNYTPNTPVDREINFAMSNSFGFGGHNASIVVGKFTG
ncbi:MAG TPA: beta-ketoacyl-[acyl-carrier-protein] synthase II [Planctomycetaceae bacterium]|jgi:3-oxoacyl-[acyl-carrier-protein] synthase II|nr:beta-ketoacyl-ACP synthase II [Pirellulales bacterium]HAL13201.1 beta-ketoacyl-[acyl-carrier-protein] synthase II [Planctomycetaceae bacterium]HCP83716.1 beta-ketoacyl-[acyl-carrier-protein] synthase II [Planctomycetaceae bacterium]|tara:strand:+ start:4397 stop:5638 length:1242 start_codon:yes stop_codon:yes gene_type:complete